MLVKPSTVRAIYRCLLADARQCARVPQFRLREPLQLEHWGAGYFVPPRSDQERKAADDGAQSADFQSLQAFLQRKAEGFRYEDEDVQEDVAEAIRRGFRANMALENAEEITERVDDAVMALQEVSEQLQLARCSSVTTTNGIRVEATSQHIPTHSNPQQNQYRFTYRVTITNTNNDRAIQVTGRQYTFESAKGQCIALPRHSPGIVGNAPLIQPGQTFEYASGVDIDAPHGSVSGCLHAVWRGDPATDGLEFDALVSTFQLIAAHEQRRP